MSFAGKKVLAFESRRAVETAQLIRRHGGDAMVAPSMREVPIEANAEAFSFAERLLAGEFEMVILLTGVGTRFLHQVMASRFDPAQIAAALQRVTLVARGPKPVAALRELRITPALVAPEPNTWREVLEVIAGRAERRIAIQEYGRPSTELQRALEADGATVTAVPVYQWALPEDQGPLREAIRALADGRIAFTLWTTSVQLLHVLEVAVELGMKEQIEQAIPRTMVCSIGPITSETLRDHGIEPDFEPEHPKLGYLVKESAERAEEILWKKTNHPADPGKAPG